MSVVLAFDKLLYMLKNDTNTFIDYFIGLTTENQMLVLLMLQENDHDINDLLKLIMRDDEKTSEIIMSSNSVLSIYYYYLPEMYNNLMIKNRLFDNNFI
jgi:hypothetical protein